jgi:hypothetical protein
MKTEGKLVLLAAFAFFIGLGCQIADALADKPTSIPPAAPTVRAASVPTAGPVAAPTLPLAAPTAPVGAPTVATVPAAATETVVPSVSPASLAAASPGSPGAQSSSCPNPNAAITSPVINSTVSGLLEIHGTATQPDMQYWKVEFRPETTTTYSGLNNTTVAVTDGILARWSTKTVPNGVYFVRLVVVQKDGNFGNPCEIRITVSN